eukprot:6434686-Lingulodinium_polyedra.AAC.1
MARSRGARGESRKVGAGGGGRSAVRSTVAEAREEGDPRAVGVRSKARSKVGRREVAGRSQGGRREVAG